MRSNRPSRPRLVGVAVRGVREAAQQVSLLVVRLLGISTFITTCRSPAPAPAQRRQAALAQAQDRRRAACRARARAPPRPRASARAATRPSAASVNGTSSRVTRSSPWRSKRGSSSTLTSTYRSPAGPPQRARVAAPRHPHALAVVDAGREVHGQLAHLLLVAAAAALLAGRLARRARRRRSGRRPACARPGRTRSGRRTAADRCPRSAGQVSIGVPGSAPLPLQCEHGAGDLDLELTRRRPSAPPRA